MAPGRDRDKSWELSLKSLIAHKAKTGSFKVKTRTTLSSWAIKQRTRFRQGKLEPHRQEKLEAIGFDLGPQFPKSDEMLQYLQEYKEKFGDLKVPQN